MPANASLNKDLGLAQTKFHKLDPMKDLVTNLLTIDSLR